MAASFPWFLPGDFRFRAWTVSFDLSVASAMGDELDTLAFAPLGADLDEPLLPRGAQRPGIAEHLRGACRSGQTAEVIVQSSRNAVIRRPSQAQPGVSCC